MTSKRATTSERSRPASQHAAMFRAQPGMSTTEFLNEFWQHTVNVAEQSEEDFKYQALPLARIKKVMKIDPEVKMISSEVMVLFEKACQIFIQEMTARAHLVSLDAKRRTLTRSDVTEATSKSDVFDFLIDLLPSRQHHQQQQQQRSNSSASTNVGGEADFVEQVSVESASSSRRTVASKGKGKRVASAVRPEHTGSRGTSRKRQSRVSSGGRGGQRGDDDDELDDEEDDPLEDGDDEFKESHANDRKRRR
ncbi:hypothetical protein ACM66B_002771 [Microbotryomycetes sp. NB124-2]